MSHMKIIPLWVKCPPITFTPSPPPQLFWRPQSLYSFTVGLWHVKCGFPFIIMLGGCQLVLNLKNEIFALILENSEPLIFQMFLLWHNPFLSCWNHKYIWQLIISSHSMFSYIFSFCLSHCPECRVLFFRFIFSAPILSSSQINLWITHPVRLQ